MKMSKRNLCIIPARGGSKRIPKKNIREFLGKPIIAYSIEAALSSALFDEVMVSTDSEEIASIAMHYGASVPFFRSSKNADDHASTIDVLIEVLEDHSSMGKTFHQACCIYPTAPLIELDKLKSGIELLNEGEHDVVFPVVRSSYPIWRSLKRDNVSNKFKMIWAENQQVRSQDLEDVFHDAGQWYWFKTDKLMEKKSLFTDNTSCIILDETEVQDIDTLSDWKMAELKYKMLKNE